MVEKLLIHGARGEKIRGYVHVPTGDGPFPAVLLAHGFKGFADYGFLPLLAERLSDAGLGVLRFSFSHCGIEDNPDSFSRADLFERDTFAHQISDVLALIAAVRDRTISLADRLDASRLAIVGHSRGGVSAILVTGATDALRAVVTLAGPSRTLHDERMRQELRTLGRISSPSSRTGEQLFIGRDLIADIDAAGERYDLSRLLARYGGAFLAVHCQADETVPAHASEDLANAHSAGPTDLLIIPDGSHTFDIRHGQTDPTPAFDAMAEKVGKFLREYV